MADMKPPKKGGKPKKIEAKGPPGGRYTPGARKGRPMPSAEERQRQVTQGIRARRGLPQMLAEQGGDQETVEAAQLIESMPGGPELLYSYAMEEMMKQAGAPKKDTKKVRLYRIGGSVQGRGHANRRSVSGVGSGGKQAQDSDYAPQKYKSGGLAKAAQRTREGGRGDDSMLLHMTPEEFEVIQAMWGPADINPDTGLPEYGFLSKIWKKVKKAVKKVFSSKIFQIVAPIALSIFAPGLGAALGKALVPALGATGQAVVGNALIRGTMSAAGGGDFATGAIQGAVAGGLGQVAGDAVQGVAPGLSDKTASLIGSSLAGGAGAELTGGDFAQGAITGGLAQMMQPTMTRLGESGQQALGLTQDEGAIFARRMTPTETANVAAGRPLDYVAPTTAELEGLAPGEVGPPAPVPGPGEPGGPAGPPAPVSAAPATVSGPAAATPAGGAAPAGGGGLGMGDIGGALLMAGMAGGFGGGEYEEPGRPEPDPYFEQRLPIYASEREFIGPTDPNAYYQYGVAGAPVTAESLFVTPDPFAGEAGTPTAPTGGLEAAGTPVGQSIAGLVQTGQIVPAAIARGQEVMLRQAGYTQGGDGNFYPPGQQQLGQGTGFAMGGMHEQRFGMGGSPVSRMDYYDQNRDVHETIPTVNRRGGHQVSGPGTGRSDDIPARLSDGEYVIDAETVALLGDGSGDAGARRLDEMRRNLRKHKAKNLKKGEFTHKAKSPEGYMPRLRAAAGRA